MNDHPKRAPAPQRQPGHKNKRVWSFSLHMRDQTNAANDEGVRLPDLHVHGSCARTKADRDALKRIIQEAQAMLDASK